MTDITELAQREKFEAWARSQKLGLSYGDCGYVFSSTEMAWRAWMASSSELVEALEKAQGMEAYWKTQCRGITDHCEVLQARIAELESHKAALLKFITDSCYVFDGADEDISDAYVDAITSGLMPKLEPVPVLSQPLFWVRVKSDGGYEGPIHDSQLEDVRKKSGEWLPLALARGIPEMESRTVKLPDEVDVLLNHLEDVLPFDAFQLIDVHKWNAVSRLSAAGIKVEAK